MSESRSFPPEIAKLVSAGGSTEQLKLKIENPDGQIRVPLSEVVSDCVKRWFHDTLKEAKAGDISMQVLVGQMYYSGYGVPRDAQKGRAWITKASRSRASVWKVSEKRPGYNASDSDSDELKDEVK
ncbi:Sel1-like [Macleaya cordata]|uniref:Sel1-like n=1 Tax=Macleaya cordata TaxID=56857 RepID=A0A200QQF0_MACCD|nr:Sel1-like [Macleaya cordata]